MAAVCERERESMPVIGIAKDRQVLRGLNSVLPEVKSMMCFGCAQIRTHVPLWQRMYNPGQTGFHYYTNDFSEGWNENYVFSGSNLNDIEMYEIGHSLEKFYQRDNANFLLHFSWEEFQKRYCNDDAPDGNPFRYSKIFEQDGGEWIQNVRFNGVEGADQQQRLLCCPQDVKRCWRCRHKKQDLCSSCCVPLRARQRHPHGFGQ